MSGTTFGLILAASFSISYTVLCFNFSYGGQLECIANTIETCSQTDKLLEVYHITEMIVFTSGICSPEPLICSEHSALNVISDLSQSVTRFNLLEDDKEELCM